MKIWDYVYKGNLEREAYEKMKKSLGNTLLIPGEDLFSSKHRLGTPAHRKDRRLYNIRNVKDIYGNVTDIYDGYVLCQKLSS